MNSHSRVVVLTCATVGQLIAVTARAQAAADSLTKGKSDGSIGTASAPADTTPKKKGGMFGKLKGLAGNKTVQNITKAAVCTAVPGGQYMVGAAEAVKAKTSIASGVAGAQSCMPGMGGGAMAGLGGMGGVPGMGAKGGLANAAMGAAGVGTAAITGKPAGGAAKGLAGVVGLPGLPGASTVAGGNRVTAVAQGMAAMQVATAQMQAASAATAGSGNGEISTEASGEQMKLSGTVADEIKKGKLVIKKIDWVRGNPSVSAPMTQGFMDVMMTAGQAIKASGATYRVDIYMDKRYSDAEIATLGAQRTTVVVSSLQAGGQLGEAVLPGKIGKDKEQRVEIVKVK